MIYLDSAAVIKLIRELATADHLLASGKHLSAFVTYDKRLADRAGDLGVVIAAPGQAS